MKAKDKLRIYLDTSVISFYFAEDAPEKMALTRKFFDELEDNHQYEVCISFLVLRELGNTKDIGLRKQLLDFTAKLQATILEPAPAVEEITKLFVQKGIIPQKVQDDAIHLALALVNRMDYILSWNFKHMVRPATRKALRELAITEGYKIVEITTPEEVLRGEENQ
jgi:predicted nucleic acid-binding protein